MKIYTDTYLRNFDFWSDAANTVKHLSDEEMDTIETELEALYPDGIDETELNDLFRFEDDYIAQILGYDDFEALLKRENDEEEGQPE